MKEIFEKIIERLDELFCGEYDTEYVNKDHVIEIVNQVASEYKEDIVTDNKWVACNESLPERSGFYIVTLDDGSVKTWFYNERLKDWCTIFQEDVYPIAWQNLPKPYVK